jgi:hypothetical protein
MNLSAEIHSVLVDWITTRPIVHPRPFNAPFPNGYQPIHLKCYRTAQNVEECFGYPIVAGIRFLDKIGKLFPWPHMVNATGPRLIDGLVDASPIPDQPDLGFVPIKLNETELWNQIVAAYAAASSEAANGQSWNCPRADDLTERFFTKMSDKANCLQWQVAAVAVPSCTPEIV